MKNKVIICKLCLWSQIVPKGTLPNIFIDVFIWIDMGGRLKSYKDAIKIDKYR